MYYEVLIALRHLTTKKGKSLSLVSLLAIAGVALGVAALVGGFSITAGFENAFRDKLLGTTAHILARPYTQNEYDEHYLEKIIKDQVPEVIGLSPTTYHKTILSGPGGTTGGFIKSLIPQSAYKVLKLSDYLLEGKLDLLIPNQTHPPMIIGSQLAHRLKVKTGDLITALSTFTDYQDQNSWSTYQEAPTPFTFKIVGIFQVGYDEYDTRFAYIHLIDAERLFGRSETVRGFEISVQDPNQAGTLAPHIRQSIKWSLGGPLEWAEQLATDPLKAVYAANRIQDTFQVQDWYAQNPHLYLSLLYQRLAILVVLSVMLILASCNVASMMIMMTLERTKEIAILKAMGATNQSIFFIFLMEGIGLAMIGSILGSGLGFTFCEGLLAQGISLDSKVYGIDYFPVAFHIEDYLYSMLGALVIIGIAVYFPANRGSKLKPTEGLREDQLDL